MNTQKNTPKETCTKPRITLFDLDSTLLPIDSDHAWGEFTIALGWVDALEFKSRNDDFYAQYRSQTLDIAEYIGAKGSGVGQGILECDLVFA